MATLPVEAGTGPAPKLPEPHATLIPTVNIAKAVGWTAGQKPIAAPGTEVKAFADRLEHPRWLYVLPNGDVLVTGGVASPAFANARRSTKSCATNCADSMTAKTASAVPGNVSRNAS